MNNNDMQSFLVIGFGWWFCIDQVYIVLEIIMYISIYFSQGGLFDFIWSMLAYM